MNLSKRFTLAELVRTSHSNKNDPTEDQVDCLRHLCISLLEPIREKFGIVRINSGFRSKSVNSAVGGSPTSDHLLGCAADITVVDMVGCAKWLKASGIEVNQVILEEYDHGTDTCRWLHVSLKARDNKNEFLVMTNKKYLKWE